MTKQATRTELAAALIDLYTELTQIKAILRHLISEEVDFNIRKYVKQHRDK